MNQNIKLSFTKNDHYLVSHFDTVQNESARKIFKNLDRAIKYKDKLEKANELSTSSDLRVKDCAKLIAKKNPKSMFFKTKCICKDFINTFEDYSIHEVTSDAVKLWMNELSKEKNYTPSTKNNIKNMISAFFKFLMKEKLVDSSPVENMVFPRERVYKHNILTNDQIERLLSKLREHSPGLLYPALLIAYYVAAKTNEILDLRWNQINLTNNTITFPAREKIQARTLQLHPAIQEALSNKKITTEYLFTDYKKKALTKNHLRCFLKEFRTKCPMRFEWTTVDLRNSFGCHFLQNGGEMEELQRIMGHKKIYVTKEIYGEYALK